MSETTVVFCWASLWFCTFVCFRFLHSTRILHTDFHESCIFFRYFLQTFWTICFFFRSMASPKCTDFFLSTLLAALCSLFQLFSLLVGIKTFVCSFLVDWFNFMLKHCAFIGFSLCVLYACIFWFYAVCTWKLLQLSARLFDQPKHGLW